jgi:hypothetical protein
MTISRIKISFAILCVALIGYFIPFNVVLSFDLSLFDLMLGALSGNKWSTTRIVLIALFFFIIFLAFWLGFKILKNSSSSAASKE